MKESTDRRVLRTRKALQDALLALMAEKPFRKIHVSDITERAGLARPTFYLHFRSREDLLLSHMDMIFERYMVEIEPFLGLDDSGQLAAILFEQLQSNSTLVRLISQSEDEITHLVMERLQEYIRAVFGAFPIDDTRREIPAHIGDFALASLTGATYALVLQWVRADMPYAPQVMGKILMSLVRPGLVDVLLGGALDGVIESGIQA
jgi:AcrR family transcriptional regulator